MRQLKDRLAWLFSTAEAFERYRRWLGCVLLLSSLGCVGSAAAGERGWDERLAGRFSPRWKSIQVELRRIEADQARLPQISLEVSGGTGGLATFAEGPVVPAGEPERRIEVLWEKPELIDLVALVPARQYDEKGVIMDYGLPDDFSVELIAESGEVIPVAEEYGARSSDVRTGYPFVYSLEKPVVAVGLRIKVLRVHQVEREGEGRYLFAFSEVYCFSQGRNVARGAAVSTPHKTNLFIHWRWQNMFLVDGQTPLGLPEILGEGHQDIGWLSNSHPSEDDSVWVVVDLGDTQYVDSLQIVPVRRPSLGNIPGFGIPQSFRIAVSEHNDPKSYKTVLDHTSHKLGSPGQNPVTFSFAPVQARYVKFEATKLWKSFENYPAYLALSEIQVFHGRTNVAAGAYVFSSDQRGRVRAHEELFWSEASLTDGYASQGKLLKQDDWLLGLDRRLKLEKEKWALGAEAESIITSVRQSVFGVVLFLGGVGLFFSIIMPVRYRLRRKRDINGVRQRIAGDLHDEVGSNLGCIQVFSDLMQQQLPASRELQTIRRIAAETVTAVRDIVWLLRAKTEERVCIAEHLRESGGILLEALEWTFEADQSFSSYNVSDEIARDLMLFYREALHNVIRHADARNVIIRMEWMDDDVVLSISDDGCGIAPEQLASANTLHALKQRAKQLQGRLRVSSTPGEGTAIILNFPA